LKLKKSCLCERMKSEVYPQKNKERMLLILVLVENSEERGGERRSRYL
jgi:hypothetical protein